MVQQSLKPIIFGTSISPQAAQYLARVVLKDNNHRQAIITYINGLVSTGIWPKLDARWIANSTQTLFNTNLVSSNFTLVEHPTPGSSPAFATDLGYTGVSASTTVYLDTQYNPSTAGLRYAQDSAHIAVWSNTSAAATGGIDMGLRTVGGTISQIAARFTGNLAIFNVNDNVTNAAGTAVSTSTGLYLANRSGSSAQQGYINGIDQGVVAVTSSALSNGTIAILGRATTAPAHELGDVKQMIFGSIGGSLTAADAMNDYILTHKYLQTISGIA